MGTCSEILPPWDAVREGARETALKLQIVHLWEKRHLLLK